MRVVAGTAKGVRLATVPVGTRPLSDRAREGLFSSLGPEVEGARVLDLFAGTGATGIEALSRGAAHAVFVDSSLAAVRTIKENLKRTNLTHAATVLRRDARRAAISRQLGQFDLILLDPPYAASGPWLDALLAEIAGGDVIMAGGLVVLTRGIKSYTPVIPLNWRPDRRLSYGDALVLMFKA